MKYTILIAFFLLFVLNGCSGTNELESLDAGRTVSYESGLPNFDMEVIPTWRNDASGIDIYIGLPYRSLVFLQNGGKYYGKYDASVRILDEKGKAAVAKEETWNEDVVLDAYETTQTIDAIAITKRFAVPAGIYVVEVTLEDGNSKQEVIRRQKITVFDLKSGALSASRILIEGRKRTNKFEPLTAYHVGGEVDSLRATIEVYNADSAPRLDVVMMLRSMRTDRMPAAAPYWFSPAAGSLTYQGIDYRRLDTLQVSRKTLTDLGSEAIFEFNLPKLKPGTYRVDIQVSTPQGNGQSVVLQKQTRDLSIKTPGFPRVETLTQLIEPLIYITSKKEFMEIVDAPTEAERKVKFDAFWGAQMPSRQLAANTLKEFYSRIEQANLLFSTYKEGWKTDQGMVYILMGAPTQIDRQFEQEIWQYSFGSRDPLATFVFMKVGNREQENTMHFQLQRNPIYEQEWYRRIERWRTGTAY